MSQTPDEREALDAVLADFRTEIHTSFPARVTAYDAVKQTVDVLPGIQREYPTADGSLATEAIGELRSIPVQWPRAGSFAITFPIAVGDWVEIQCAEQSLLVWRLKGDPGSPPGISDPHGLNGCCAKPGWYPDKEKLSNVDPSFFVIRTENNSVRIVMSGSQVVLGDTSGAQFVALANKVATELSALKTAISGAATVANDGGAAFKSNLLAALSSWPASTAASMVKAK